jgi:hypothetical protein
LLWHDEEEQLAMAGITVLLENAKEYNLPADLFFGNWRKLDGDMIEKIINWLWKGQNISHARGSLSNISKMPKNVLKS